MSITRAEVKSFAHDVTVGSGVTADYVVAHAKRQRQRGRAPSVAYKGINNPRLALIEAQTDIESRFNDNQKLFDHTAEFSGRIATVHLFPTFLTEERMNSATAYALRRMMVDDAVGAIVDVVDHFDYPTNRGPHVTESGLAEVLFV